MRSDCGFRHAASAPSAASSIGVARSDEEVAQDIAQVFLVLDDEDAFGHVDALLACGADRQLHLERRAFAHRRFHPDATAMHLYDLLGDGKAEPGPAFGLGVGAVDLVELLEDARLLVGRDTWPGIGHADSKVAVARTSR